jgi:predicted MFS family arabinose efflux permease
MADPAPTPAADSGEERRVALLTGALAVTVFFGFGLLVFAIAVVLPEMMEELGWSNAAVSSGLTIGLLSAGLAAPAVGTIIDRHGGRAPMAVGAVITSAGMVLWSLVTTYPAYVAAWLVMGAGMALVLYEAAFTTMVRHAPARRRHGLLVISFLGALSSTAFIPVTELLVRTSGWRTALIVLAAANLVVVTPLAVAGVPGRGRVIAPEPSPSAQEGPHPGDAPGVSDAAGPMEGALTFPSAEGSMLRDPQLRRIGMATLLGDAPVYAVSVHIVAYLIVSGRSTAFAATMGGVVGLAKLAGRVGVGLVVRRVGSYTLLVSGYLLVGIALALPLLPASATVSGALDVAMAIGFGVGAGAQTVTRPMYVSDLYGTVGFGRTFGRISRIGRFSMALAPGLVGVLVTGTGGYAVAWTAMAIGSVAAARVLPSGRRGTRAERPSPK